MGEAGEVFEQGRFRNQPEAVARFLGSYGGDQCAAVLEAARNRCVMHDWLEGMVEEVALAHPLKVRAIAEARGKTDKIHATTLAHLLRCDLIPRAHVSSPAARVVKNLLRHRMFLVRVQTMTKNRVHVLLDRHPGVRSCRPVVELFTNPGRAWLKSVELAESDRWILDNELALLEEVRQRIREAHHRLRRVGQADTRVRRLLTIPGVGRILAALLVSEIDTIDRFRSAAKLRAYAGLIPSTHASGGKTFHGRLVRQGNKYIRWAMVEAVWPAMRKEAALRRYYERLARRKGPNSAKVATARRLLTMVYRVWKEEREYQRAA